MTPLKRKIYDALVGITFDGVTKDELSNNLIQILDTHITEFTHWLDDIRLMGLDLYHNRDISELYDIYLSIKYKREG